MLFFVGSFWFHWRVFEVGQGLEGYIPEMVMLTLDGMSLRFSEDQNSHHAVPSRLTSFTCWCGFTRGLLLVSNSKHYYS